MPAICTRCRLTGEDHWINRPCPRCSAFMLQHRENLDGPYRRTSPPITGTITSDHIRAATIAADDISASMVTFGRRVGRTRRAFEALRNAWRLQPPRPEPLWGWWR